MFGSTNVGEFLAIFVENGPGLALNVSFVWCFWKFASPDDRVVVETQMYVFFGYTVVSGAAWLLGGADVLGYSASAINALMLAAPLAAARHVVRTRSTQGWSFAPLFFTVVCSVAWLSFGVYDCNLQIIVPNTIGVLAGIAQLALFKWARDQRANSVDVEDEDERAWELMELDVI